MEYDNNNTSEIDIEEDLLRRKAERAAAKKKRLVKVFFRYLLLFIVLDVIGLCVASIFKKNTETYENVAVPEVIKEFVKKYPEAAEYADNYGKYHAKDLKMDVSSEMKDRDIPLFIQWDKRWGYKDYGEGYVGTSGCGPTCIAMVACGLLNDETINPYEVAKYSDDQGFYVSGQGTSWSLMTEGAKHYGINGEGGKISAKYIKKNLSEDTPLICSMKPGDFTTSGHFIVLTGFDDDGLVIVNDPNSRNNSDKHWEVDVLVSQMKGIWKYSR